MFKSRTGTFTKTSFGQSLLKSQVGTIVKFCCRVFDRDPNYNIQESLRCKFFEKISGLIISLMQIPDSFLHLFLTSVNSSRELTWVIWSLRSHLGQFLNCKPTQDVPSRPDSTWASVLPVQKIMNMTRLYHKKCCVKKKTVDQHCYTDQQNEQPLENYNQRIRNL